MAANSEMWEKANDLVETACKQDNNVRLKTGPQLILFLDGKGKLDSRQADQLIDAMTDWLQSSNFKISLMAIDVFNVLVFKLASIDRHSPTILSALLETLKTSNDQVREQVQHLLGAITDKCTPAVVADKICINGLTHKAWRVREETLVWIINTLDIHGKEGLQVSKFVPQVCNLVVDANVDVRDRAVQLLVEVYKNVGDRLKLDLEKKQLVPDASKRKVLFQKFEEAKANNLMKVANSPTSANGPGEINGEAKTIKFANEERNQSKLPLSVKKLRQIMSPNACNSPRLHLGTPKLKLFKNSNAATPEKNSPSGEMHPRGKKKRRSNSSGRSLSFHHTPRSNGDTPTPRAAQVASPGNSSRCMNYVELNAAKLSSTLARVNGAVKSASNTATTSSRPAGGGAVNRSNSVSSASGKTLAARKASTSGGGLPSGASNAGGIGTSEFQKTFDEIKPVTIYSARNLDEDLTKIKDTLENADNDWKVRVNEMKKLCSIFKANAFTNYSNELNNHLKDLTRVLSISVKDLRSQVSREACVTVAYMCQIMGLSAATLAEGCLSNLFAIVPNSAKIIATSGCTALMYITQHVHSAKLIPSLLTFQSTKSIPCRLQLSRMLEDILRNWDSSVLDKYFTNVEDCMVKLLSDADEKTRSFARKSFFALKDRFPSRADILMGTLDPRVQRKLTGEGSYGSSVTSLAASMSQSSLGSQESLGGRSMSSVTRMGVKNSTNSNFKKSLSTHDIAAARNAALTLSPPTQTTLHASAQKAPTGADRVRMGSSTRGVNVSGTAASARGNFAPVITPISATPNSQKYRRKSSPRIGVSSLNVRTAYSSSVQNLASKSATEKVLASNFDDINVKTSSGGRNRKASLGNELDLDEGTDENYTPALLDTSSAESGFAEDLAAAIQVKRTIGPGDRSKIRPSRTAQSQRCRSESPSASRSGSRGTSPQTARLNIMTSPTVVSSSVTSPRASVTTGIPAPSPASHHRTQLQEPTSLSYTPNAQRSQHSKIGSSPSSGLGTSLSSYNKRSAIRSLNTSRDHSPASSIGGTRSTNRSSIGSSGSHYSQQRSLQLTPQSASRFQKIQHERQHQLHQPQSMRMLVDNPEAVKFVEHALMSTNHGSTSPYSVGAQRRPRYDSYGTVLSDDDSDRCSLQSYDSRYDRDFEVAFDDWNMAEVLEKCSAQNWSDRKEGLLSLQAALRSRQCQLNRQEIRKATEIFTRMFGDPHVKVLSLFLEVLADFVVTYFETLADWLSVLLPKLLQKTGAENLLNSGLMKVNRCLEIVREKFALDHQFVILMKYIADQTQTKSLKVKLALLKYLLSVIRELNSHEFVNSADTRQALQLVLTWSTDKNAEIRRNAVAVVTSLFDLNTAEFNALQNALPKKELQHLANNILHQYVNNFENNNNHNSSFSSSTNIAATGNVNGSSSFLSTSGVAANSAVDSTYSPHANNYRSLPRNYKVLRSPLQQQQQQPPTSLNLSTQQRRGASGSSSNISSPNLHNSAFNRTGPAAIPSLSGVGGPSPGGRERKSSTSSNKSFGGVYSGGGGSGLNTVANSGRSSGGRARGAEYLDVDAAGDGGLGGGDEQLPRTPNSQQALLYKTTSDIHKYFDTQNNNAGSGEGYDSAEVVVSSEKAASPPQQLQEQLAEDIKTPGGIPSMPNSNVDLHGDLGSNNRIYDPSHYQDKSILESPDFIAKRPFDLDDDVDEFLSSNRNHHSTTPGSKVVNKGSDDVIEADAEGDHLGLGGSRGDSVNMMQQQEDEKLVEAILQELSHHNSRIEQRKSALISLTKLIKEGNAVVWEEHFKMCLMMLFETMSDKEPTIRALVLRVLREFLKHQQHRFQQYAEITILKTLDAHKDSHKDVVRASEELTYSVVNAIEHARCLQVLCPVVAAGDFPINQTAVKMLTKIIEDSPPEEVETFVEQVCPALMKAYEHQESSVRKDSVYGLVAVHQKVGQAMLDQYTNSLSHGKLKLLRLYISRAGGTGSGAGASGTTGGAGTSTVSSGSGDKKSTSNHASVAPSLNQPQQIGSTGAKN
ncbi:CLIP-associating protein 2-like isoform X3 [Convolutriloba macropyga]|uniref:CLIP-associating protein 2-like isoform X3 n=1 Tax=Convolutriloba macropyga TaxID=536237 RepID=UPI003F51DDD9